MLTDDCLHVESAYLFGEEVKPGDLIRFVYNWNLLKPAGLGIVCEIGVKTHCRYPDPPLTLDEMNRNLFVTFVSQFGKRDMFFVVELVDLEVVSK